MHMASLQADFSGCLITNIVFTHSCKLVSFSYICNRKFSYLIVDIFADLLHVACGSLIKSKCMYLHEHIVY